MHPSRPASHWIKESAFGVWFLNTSTWKHRVLRIAIEDLYRLSPEMTEPPVILDVGSGRGHAFELLVEYFQPRRIDAIEIDQALIADTLKSGRNCSCPVNVIAGNAERLPYRDTCFDMVFCHQSFHHLVRQPDAMREFYRVLKSGGQLLFAESCKRFIHSLPIRLLFSHPMQVQKTAGEYIDLIRAIGLNVESSRISTPYLWWSRPILDLLTWPGQSLPEHYEPTLVNLVAIK